MIYKTSNAYYHRSINKIGGIESHLFYLVKKYQYDIIIFFHKCDEEQLRRLKRYCRCVQLKDDDIVECDVLFTTYGMTSSVMNQFEAGKVYYIVHADYLDQIAKGTLPLNACDQNYRVDKYLSVSKVAQKGFKHPSEVIYMPIDLEVYDEPIMLLSATRLSQEKGYARMRKLAEILDQQGVNYLWDIYTSSTNIRFNSPNVRVFPSRIDIVSKMPIYDALVQLSDSEAYCVAIHEAMQCGLAIISTPIPLIEELNAKGVVLPFDMEDIDIDAIKNIKKVKQKYSPIEDRWDDYLVHSPSRHQKVRVRATSIWKEKSIRDVELNRIPNPNEEYEIDIDRYYYLLDRGKKKNRVYIELADSNKPNDSL